jgi:DNA-binding LacI/PurR family transcriptional regulator
VVKEILRQRLLTGVWRPNDRLPSERDLAEELNVCAATVQRHLRELQNEGLIWGWPGKGRFVTGVGQRPRTGNIGVVLFDSRHMANPAMSDVVASIGAIAAEAKRGLRIFIGNELQISEKPAEKGPASNSDHAGFLGSPSNLGVDGLIVLTQRIDPDAVRRLATILPVVSSHLLPIPNVSCVVLDMAAGAYDAMRHLLDLGHRHIAMLTKQPSDAFARAARDGARLAIGGLGASQSDVNLEVHTAAEFEQAEGYRLGKEILAQSARPTAVICVDDKLPLGVLQAAEEMGLQVPRDLSVIAWHDALAERKPVSITSVTFDRADAGARMCNRLLEYIETPAHQYEPEYVRPHLLVRQSTAAPRSR